MKIGVVTKKTILFFGICLAFAAGILYYTLDTVQLARSIQTASRPRELPIYSVATNDKIAAIGINCAWDDSGLDGLLAMLEKRQVKATFFMVGDWCEKYPDAAKKIAQAGHEIGSHSHTHPDMTTLGKEQILSQLAQSKTVIDQTCGTDITLFRPPSGAYNDLSIATAREAGWEVIQWSNDSLDWKGLSVDEISARVTGQAAPGDIMLFHLGKENMAPALERVVDTLSADGYRFLTVGEMVYPEPYQIDHTGRQFHIGSETVGTGK